MYHWDSQKGDAVGDRDGQIFCGDTGICARWNAALGIWINRGDYSTCQSGGAGFEGQTGVPVSVSGGKTTSQLRPFHQNKSVYETMIPVIERHWMKWDL